MDETLNSILSYCSYLLFGSLFILFLWIIIICFEYLLNRYYGYRRFNFSKTYYSSNPRVSNSFSSI
jgi:hypothetical protein